MSYPFTDEDLVQLDQKGICRARASSELETFARGLPYCVLDRPCTAGDGITVIDHGAMERYVQRSERAARSGRLMKFVPASGAATRMFQSLLAARERCPDPEASVEVLKGTPEYEPVKKFLTNIHEFAFYPELRARMKKNGHDADKLAAAGVFPEVLSHVLTERGLNYGSLPKGLIKFHLYGHYARTPLEEHLVEAAACVADSTGRSRVHFTVAGEHRGMAAAHLEAVRGAYENEGRRYDVTFSVQKPSTDTLAADMENNPFRESDGSMLFRPGGHGALLENLNDLHGDIVLIKNIDNVAPDRLKQPAILYKKVLSGLLVELQNDLFDYLRRLHEDSANEALVEDAMEFARAKLAVTPDAPAGLTSRKAKLDFLWQKLNRPLRVCGMVRSTGEPGGGPFWVRMADGASTLQIVESSEVDMEDADQKEIFGASTHFNPVDLVCGVRDYTGKPFDLLKYSDPERGLISIKSKDGKSLKALELPGLWNGGMTHWNTVFVEVPEETFSPVKTILDLLRKEHLPLSNGGTS